MAVVADQLVEFPAPAASDTDIVLLGLFTQFFMPGRADVILQQQLLRLPAAAAQCFGDRVDSVKEISHINETPARPPFHQG